MNNDFGKNDKDDSHSIPTEYTGTIYNNNSSSSHNASFYSQSDNSGYSQQHRYDTPHDSPYYQQSPQYEDRASIPGYYTVPKHIHKKALLGLIFAFWFFPVGLWFSWAAWKELKHSNDHLGRLMSKIGLIVSGICTGFVGSVMLLGLASVSFQFFIAIIVFFFSAASI